MIKIVKASFPFIKDMSNKARSEINGQCHPREKGDPLCPFVNLAAHTFSCSLVLATLTESAERMRELNSRLSEIYRELTEIAARLDHTVVANIDGALRNVDFLMNRLIRIRCPKHPIVNKLGKKIPLSKIRRSIREISNIVLKIEKKQFCTEKDKQKALLWRDRLEELREPIDEWALTVANVRQEIVKHVWDCREDNLSINKITREKWKEKLDEEVRNIVQNADIWNEESISE